MEEDNKTRLLGNLYCTKEQLIKGKKRLGRLEEGSKILRKMGNRKFEE